MKTEICSGLWLANKRDAYNESFHINYNIREVLRVSKKTDFQSRKMHLKNMARKMFDNMAHLKSTVIVNENNAVAILVAFMIMYGKLHLNKAILAVRSKLGVYQEIDSMDMAILKHVR